MVDRYIRCLFDTMLAIFAAVCILGLILLLIHPSHAKPGSYVPSEDPAIGEWYRTLMQPDTVGSMGQGISCCGEGDAYWADEVHYRNGKMYAVITDNRPDPPNRMHEEIGTEYEIPPQKIVGMEQHIRGNPTGHTIIFLGTRQWIGSGEYSKRWVLCFVMNGGV